VKIDNAAEIARAGADTLVAGSAVFGSSDYAATIRSLRAQGELGQRGKPGR
jgi:ribulose-phosphate 3-epimerase